MAVVSAGAKAILDLPRTLEMLDTLGVLVVGYRTHDFPAFYTRTSGLILEHSVDSPAELALMPKGIDAVVPWDYTNSLIIDERKSGRPIDVSYPYLWRNLTTVVATVLEQLGLDPRLAPRPGDGQAGHRLHRGLGDRRPPARPNVDRPAR